MKILIVDDNKDLADGVSVMLEDEGHEVTVVYNANDAFNAIAFRPFDLAFVDMKLPDDNGIEVMMVMKNQQPQCRVILMTAYRIEQLLELEIGPGKVSVLRNATTPEKIMDSIELLDADGVILLADDDPKFSEKARRRLLEENIKVNVLRCAEDLNNCKGDTEICIVDSGGTLLQNLQLYLQAKKIRKPKVAIFVLPASKGDKETDLLHEFSATGCVFKPFKPQALLDVVAQIQS